LFRGSQIGLVCQSPLPDIAGCFADRLDQNRHTDGAGVNAEMRGHLQYLQDFPVVGAEPYRPSDVQPEPMRVRIEELSGRMSSKFGEFNSACRFR
jgi:hypothetical protein